MLCALALAWVGGAGAPSKAALPLPDAQPPVAGRFLIATEQIRGSIFHEAVVYLVSCSAGGALGLIVNHPSGLTLHDVVQGADRDAGPLFRGGPVEPGTVMMLLRSDSPPDGSLRVAGDVFLSVDMEVLLDRTAKAGARAELRVFSGYAGWAPGQLDREISRGDWIVAPADAAAIFDEETGGLWKKLFARHHRLLTRAPRRGPAA